LYRTFKTTIKKVYTFLQQVSKRILQTHSPDPIGNIDLWESPHHLTAGYEGKSGEDGVYGLVTRSGKQYQLLLNMESSNEHVGKERDPPGGRLKRKPRAECCGILTMYGIYMNVSNTGRKCITESMWIFRKQL